MEHVIPVPYLREAGLEIPYVTRMNYFEVRKPWSIRDILFNPSVCFQLPVKKFYCYVTDNCYDLRSLFLIFWISLLYTVDHGFRHDGSDVHDALQGKTRG